MQNRGTNETPTKSSSHHPLSSSLPLSSSSSLPRTPTTPAAPTFLRSSQTVLTAGGTPVRINSQPHLRSQQQQQQQQQRQQLGVQATIRGIAVYDGSLTPRKALQTSQVTPTTAPATSSRPGIDISSSVRLPTARRDLFSPVAHKMDSSTRGSSRLARHSEAALRTSSAASASHPTSSTPRRQTMTPGSSASSPPPAMPGPSGLPKPLGVAAKSRRSEVHAQEVDQLRAQSRAGFSSRGRAGLEDEDDDSDADIDDHRRVLSPRHGRNARRGTSPFSGPSARLSSSGHDTSETEATQRPSNRRRSQAAAATSPRYSTLAHLPSASSRRQPLPDEFLPPSSSSPRTRQESEETILNRPSEAGDAADHRASSSRAPRRRRYASDAHADEIPSFQYEGRGGTGAARLSVDASSVKRHLAAAARARTTSGPQAAAAAAATSTINTLSPRLAMREFAESSSPVPRTRGMSVASSSIARPSSRMSAVGAATTDLFDDNSMRSPTLRARPDLPPEALERVRALRLRQEALQAVPLSSRKDGGTSSGASAGIDDVRARIEDIDIRGSAIASSSRSSSVISSAPRPRAHTAQLDRQRLLAEQSRGPAPLSEPRRLADPRRIGAGGSEEPYRANGHATMHETLRRHASHAAFPSTPDAFPHQRPASRFSTLSRGVTPGPVLKSTSSAAARGGATTAHERNLLVAFDLFERNFGGPSGSDNANHTSPTAARLYGPESGELVEKARGFLDTVTTLNAGLRDVAQYVIQREIDAEVDASLDVPPASSASASSSSRAANPVSTLALLKELDQAVGSLVKYSDNQVRNLGELLAAFTRADRERTRARTAMGGAEYDRSDSRMSHTGTPTNWSPTRHGSARRGNTLGSAAANLSMDAGSDRSLRRAGSLAPSSGLRRETRDIRQAATTASSSAAGSDSGSIDRRSSIWRSGDRSSAVGGGGGSIAGNGIIAPDDPRTSPTMSVSSSRPRTTMGAFAANHHHGRSYSELSPGPLAPERSPSATRQRLAFLTQRREQREQGVATLGRSSTSGAPRRPKLSDPSLATAIAVSSKTHAMSDRPIVYDDAAGALGHAYQDDGEGLEGEDAEDYFDDAGPSRDSTADGRGGETPRLGMRTSRDEMPPPPAFSRQHRAAAHLSRRTISPIGTTAAQQQQLDDEEPYERIRSATEGPSNASTSDASFASQPPLPSPTRPLRNPRRSMVLSRSGSGSGTFSEVQSGDRSGGAGLASSSFDVILDGYHSTTNGTAPDQVQQRPQSVAGYSSSSTLASRHAPASAQMPQQSKGPSAWRHPNGLEGVRGSSLLPHSASSASPTSSSSAGAAAMAHTLSARTSLRQSLAAAADQEGRGPAGRGA